MRQSNVIGVQQSPKYTSSACLKDTHKENTPSSKTQAITKSMKIDTWVVSTLNQLFI